MTLADIIDKVGGRLQLAIALNVSERTIRRWEQDGLPRLPLEVAIKLAKIANCKVEELKNGC